MRRIKQRAKRRAKQLRAQRHQTPWSGTTRWELMVAYLRLVDQVSVRPWHEA